MTKKLKITKNYLYLGGVILIVALFYFGSIPLKKTLAEKYLLQGDQALLAQKYLVARLDYQKAEALNKSEVVENRKEIASKAEFDILELKALAREKNNIDLLDAMNQAETVPATSSEGLKKVKALLENKRPQLAVVAANIVLEMDRKNRDAWLYSGIAHLSVAKTVLMSEAGTRANLEKARAAFSSALQIDPSSTMAKDYLTEISK